MPIFTIQTPDGRHVDIEANDEQTAINGAKQWAASQQAPRKVGVGEDVVKGGATGLGQGVTAPLGIRGDAANLINLGAHGIGALVNKVAPGYGDVISGLADAGARMPSSIGGAMNPMRGLSSGDVQKATGLTYQAQTLPGKIAQKVGQFAPAALNPASLPQRVASVAIPALGGVAGREVVKASGGGEGAQAAGEFIGELGGGFGAGLKAPKIGPKVKAPSLEDLQQARTAAYKAVDDMGVEYKPEAVNTLVQGVNDALAGQIEPGLHPSTVALARRVNAMKDQPVTLGKLDQVRQMVGNELADVATKKGDKRLLHTIRDNIDEFINAAGPDQVTAANGADPAKAAQVLQRARDLHARTAKVEAVNKAVVTAQQRTAISGVGGNIDNNTRQELRKVLTRQRGLTPDEQASLNDIVYGSFGQDTLRRIGKFSPTGGTLGAAMSMAAAAKTGGASIPFSVGGMVAKSASDNMTANKVGKLVTLMAQGGKKAVVAENTLAQLAKGNPKAKLAYQKVAQRLLVTGGLAASSALAPAQSAAAAGPTGR